MFRQAKRAKWALVALGMCVFPGVANADSTCDKLFNGLRAAPVLTGALTDVRALWATNYFIPERGARFMGTTQIVLGLQNGDLFGTGTRSQMVYSADPAQRPFKRTDEVSLRIRRDGRIMLNDQYGPFDPTCSYDKYAVIKSGDSVEVFTLYRTNPLTVTIVGGEPERPSYLTLFEHDNFTGRSHSMPVSAQPLEHGTGIPSNALRQAGLWGKVSSARLECGTRASRATLLDVDWSKDSKGTMINCKPGETASVNLAAIGLNDKINAAALMAHVRGIDGDPIAFSDFFAPRWRDLSGYSPTTTEIWLLNFNSFIVAQWVTLDHPACFERTGNFTLRVTLTTRALKPFFQVDIVDRNVLGDRWGCYSGMLETLNSRLAPIPAQVQSELNSSLGNLTGQTFYFAPAEETKSFHLFYGG